MNEITLNSVRNELRHCIFQLVFHKGWHELSGTDKGDAIGCSIMNILAFGVNSGLIEKEEREVWLKASTKELRIIDIMKNYPNYIPKEDQKNEA